MLQEIVTSSEEDTASFAKDFALGLPARKIVFLEGPLGAGKSIFARSLIRELAQDAELNVPSPTFTLLQVYDTKRGPVWHYDLYRLKDPEEMQELSWDDALADGIVLIEWPEKLQYLKPEGITVAIEPLSETIRRIRISA